MILIRVPLIRVPLVRVCFQNHDTDDGPIIQESISTTTDAQGRFRGFELHRRRIELRPS